MPDKAAIHLKSLLLTTTEEFNNSWFVLVCEHIFSCVRHRRNMKTKLTKS